MKTLLAALEEGRLIELPENNKDKALQILGSLIEAVPGLDQAKDLNELRIRLLDVISASMETDVPADRARMVRIEARQAAAAATPPTGAEAGAGWPAIIVPFQLVVAPGKPTLVLAQDRDLVAALETATELPGQLAKMSMADAAGYRIVMRHTIAYAPDRAVYDCLALKFTAASATVNGAPASAPQLAAPKPAI